MDQINGEFEQPDDNLDSVATGGSSAAPILSQDHIDRMNAKLQRGRLMADAAQPIAPEAAGNAISVSKQTNIPPMLALDRPDLKSKLALEVSLGKAAAEAPTLIDFVTRDPVLLACTKDELDQLAEMEKAAKRAEREVFEGTTFTGMLNRIRASNTVVTAENLARAAEGTGAQESMYATLRTAIEASANTPKDMRMNAALAKAERQELYGDTLGAWMTIAKEIATPHGAGWGVNQIIESLGKGIGAVAIDTLATAGNLASGDVTAAALAIPTARVGRRAWDALSPAARKNVAGAASVGGGNALMTYEGQYGDALVEGWEKSDPTLSDRERAIAAREYAQKKSSADAAVNAAVTPLGLLAPGGLVGRSVGVGTAAAVAGGVGAAAGAVAVGEEISAGEMALETFLEVPGLAVDVPVSIWAERKAEQYNEKVKGALQRAQETEQLFRKLTSSASSLALVDRAPGTLTEFVNLVAEHHGRLPQELSIGMGKLVEIVGEEAVADLRTKSETFDQQVDEALTNDAEVTIPTGQFVEWSAKMTPEQQKELARSVREHPGAMTLEEAEEAQTQLDRFNQESETLVNDKNAEDADYIYKTFFEALNAADTERMATTGVAGVGKTANAKYAELVKHAMITIADRVGMKPRDLFDRFFGGVSAAEKGAASSLIEDDEQPAFQNVIHDRPALQVGKPKEDTHVSEAGYTYRTMSPAELQDAKDNGVFRSRGGKSSGGRTNVKHWVRGGTGQFFHRGAGGGVLVRVRNSDISTDAPVAFSAAEVRNEQTGEFEPVAPLTYTTNEGRKFKDFFARITSGTAGAPKTSAASVKVLDRDRNPEFTDEFMKHSGNFDRHIEASIPGFRDIQFVVAEAITEVFENAKVLDIGASEGALVKTVAAKGDNLQVTALDPNPQMAETFAKMSQVPGATYSMTALGTAEQEGQLAWTEDDGTEINYFKPDGKYDVVHEAMVFQFISNDRESQIARVAELLSPTGVAIFEQKFIAGEGLSAEEWKANEEMKDAFKEQFFSKEDMAAKAESVLVGMNQNMVSPGEFERVLSSKFVYVARFWKSGNFAGYIATNDAANFDKMIAAIGDTSSPFSESTVDQSVPLRRGTQTLRKYGLEPGERHNTRDVAAALEARQREKYGAIPPVFDSEEQRLEAEKKIARWIAEEVEFEMEDPNNTATGWYSDKFQRAIDIMAEVYPELATDKVARDTLTLLIAITSDGQKVQGNFLQAMDIYGNYRTGGATEGKFTTDRGHQRMASINNNLAIIQRLHDTMGAEKMHAYLMQEKTVKELKKAARDAGGEFNSAYLATETVPMAALELGEKLGAFYANLMGAHGYLTMDRWWSRTFNRYRGTLLTNATPEALAKFREIIGNPALSDDETLAATVPYRNALAARGFKTRLAVLMDRESQPAKKKAAEVWLAEAKKRAGDQFDEMYKEHLIERAANSIYKDAFEKLEDAPFNGSDRSFMIAATKRAQKLLKRRGIDTSVADIQAILWYYEKQLYGDLGARQSGKLSYEDASRRVVDAIRSGNAADLAAVRAGVGEESDEEGFSLGDEEFLTEDSKLNQENVISPNDPLPGAPIVRDATGPIPELVAAAEKYAADNGIPFKRQAEYVFVDEARAKRIADAYAAMQHAPNDPEVKAAYDDLIRQTRAQYDALVAAGYSFTFFDSKSDPYNGNPYDAMRDLRANKRMAVYGTYDGFGTDEEFDPSKNLLLVDTGLMWPDQSGVMHKVTANDLFRAVHDAFGHGLEGAGFRARGEENAWVAHKALFTGPALGALTSETRGQNSWLNYGPHGEHNRTAKVEDTIFADQKSGLMPSWTWEDEKRDVTSTAKFKRWFRNSKVVDAYGKPLIVYHGTAGDFRVFDPKLSGRNYRSTGLTYGFSFTSSPETASVYAEKPAGANFEPGVEPDFGDGTANIMPVYLSLQNPVVVTTKEAAEKYLDRNRVTLKARADKRGADGIIVHGSNRSVFVAFRSEQIKSVYNSGEFNPDNPDVLNQEQMDLFNTVVELDAMEKAAAAEEGLDMSLEARMSRAKTMGFDTERVWYHSSRRAGYRSFDLPTTGKTAGTGIFLSSSRRISGTYAPGLSREVALGRPDEILADPEKYGVEINRNEDGTGSVLTPDGYETEFTSEQELVNILAEMRPEESPGIYELFVRLNPEEVFTIDWGGKYWSDGPLEESWEVVDEEGDIVDWLYDQSEVDAKRAEIAEDGSGLTVRRSENKQFETTDDAAAWARKNGFAAIEILNVIDPGPYSSRLGGGLEATTLVVFDPSNIRMTNAAFDPEFAKSEDLLAQKPKSKRGSFDVRSFNIALIDPNKSTTLHELGHMFFEMMLHLAADENAPKQIVDDVNAMLKFVGFNGSAADYLQVPVAQRRVSHETMAEHFEAYLRSGKAPTVELQGLFRTFARWLIEVYGALTQMIGVGKLGNVNMDDELRAIFDRMLASDAAIEQSAKIRGLLPAFESAEQAGMTDEEFAEYQSAHRDTIDGANEQLRSRMIRDMKWLNNLRAKTIRDLTAQAKAQRKAVRDEVTAEVDRMRVYRVMHLLKRGVLIGEDGTEIQAPWILESTKLNKAAVEAMYPNGEIDIKALGFGKYGMVSADGVDPGMLAGLFGYDSADAMVREIAGAEKRADLIDGLTEQRLLERHGSLVTDEDIARAADEALASEAHTRMVATELAGMDAKQGKVSVLRKAARYAAMGLVGRRTVRNTRPDLSASAATRARKQAASALAKGKRDEATAAKRNELLHVEMERQGREAKAEIDKVLATARKIWKGTADKISKNRDVDLTIAARLVLGRYAIGSPVGIEAAAKYVDLLNKYGGPHTAQVAAMIATLPEPKDYRDLTVDEFRQVADIALGLWQMALDEKSVTIDGQKVAVDAIADEIVATIEAKHGGQLPVERAQKRTPTPWDEKVDMLYSLRANLTRVEFWAGDMGAIFKRAIHQPVQEAITKYRQRRAKMLERFKVLLDEVSPGLTFSPITCKPGEIVGEDGKPFTFSRGKSEILHAILHTGNQSNRKKLLLGRGWGVLQPDGSVTSPGWDALIARLAAEGTLTKADFDFCQKVWDLLETLKPDAQAAHKAVYGFYFHEITANELNTPFGVYRGGYVPAVVDPRDVSESEAKKDAEELLQSGNSFAFPTAPTGFTKARVEYNRPLHLDLRVLAAHIDKVCRFTDVQAPVRDVAKLLMNKRVAKALNAHDRKVVNNMLIPWLQVSANQVTTKPGKDKNFDKLISTIDSRTGMAIMFASVINTLQQTTGFSMALARTDEGGKQIMPAGALLRSLAVYVQSPKEHVALAVQRSAWLDDRMHNQTMEMRGAIEALLLDANVIEKAAAFFAKHAYFLQVALQNVIDPVLFNAAYDNAIAKGATAKQAARAGEELIRTTQGTFAAEDVSAVEINAPLVRSMLKFYGYFNMWGNLLGSEANKALREAGYFEKSRRLFLLYMSALAIPAYTAALIAGGLPGDDDDEDGDGMLDEYLAQFFGAQGRSVTAMIPGVGPLSNFAIALQNDKPYDDRLNVSPLASTVESAVRGADNLLRGEYLDDQLTKKEARDLSTLLAIAVGVPTGPMVRAYGYEKDVEAGRIDEREGLGEVWGYITGK